MKGKKKKDACMSNNRSEGDLDPVLVHISVSSMFEVQVG